MESFFDTLKRAGVNRPQFHIHAQARSAIFASLECWDNQVRVHSTVQSVSPLVSKHAFAPSVRESGFRPPHI